MNSLSIRGRWRRALILGLLAALLASCVPIPLPRPGPSVGRPPIADRPITIAGSCSQTEEDGFREQAKLDVIDNQVKALSWQLWVGRRGSCRFEFADFRQTRTSPIELQARDGSGCRLLIWQDPRRVTLAHEGCEARCTKGIYDSAWPVMFDPQSGKCGRIG